MLKSYQKGLINLQIKTPEHGTYYKTIESDKLYDFLMSMEYYSDVNGYDFHWIIPETVRYLVKKHYNANNNL